MTSRLIASTNCLALYSALYSCGGTFPIVLPGSTDFDNAFWDQILSWADIFTDDATAITNWTNNFTLAYYNADGELSAPSALTQGSFTFTGNTLSWPPIPEPSTALAGLLLTAGLLRRRRKSVEKLNVEC